MRVSGFVFLSLAAMAGEAQASSIVMVGDSSSTPSIVRLQARAPAKAAEAAPVAAAETTPTPSIIALGEPAPDVAYEKVGAIPAGSMHGPLFTPMVIRGGITGDASRPASSAPAATTAAAAPAKPAAPAAASSPENPGEQVSEQKLAKPFVPARASTPTGTRTLK